MSYRTALFESQNIASRANLYRVCEILAGRRLDFKYDSMSFHRYNLRFEKMFNFLLSRLEAKLRVKKPFAYPVGLQIEPTINCQLTCPLCPRMKTSRGLRPGHMGWDQYEMLMREIGPRLIALALWQWGEPFLHPRIIDMVRLAHNYNIFTIISTNGQFRPKELNAEDLVRSGLDMLIINMDGATEKVFEAFRSGGSLKNVRRFTSAVVKAKRNLGSNKPLLNVRIIATKENEMEVGRVRAFARRVGADAFSVKSLCLFKSASPSNPHLPEELAYRSFQYRGMREWQEYIRMPNLCLKPWSWPTLRYNGTLLMCECDHYMHHVLGNVFNASSFREVWRNKKAQRIRSHFHHNGIVDLDFCLNCGYKLDDAIRYVKLFGST